MPDYIEIEEPKEIRRLNSVLARRLKQGLAHVETRIVGYPQGSFEAKVHFRSRIGHEVLYWSTFLVEDKSRIVNLFGHGTPGDAATLNIDVQFNVPVIGAPGRGLAAEVHGIGSACSRNKVGVE
jgi:hypothetical protein